MNVDDVDDDDDGNDDDDDSSASIVAWIGFVRYLSLCIFSKVR